MNVQKKTITVTLLIDDSVSDSDMIAYSLEEIAREIDSGDWLGKWEVTSSVPVPDDQVQMECEAIGNDGTFFVREDS
jgi:hypothetical protein